MRAATLLVLLCHCASAYLQHGVSTEPFDAVIVPGCPSLDDGSLSRCQLGRAGVAALIWREGRARDFIVSGGAVHSPFIEAVAIAQAMVVLGVPAAHIVLEPNALHTDENMYFSLQLVRALGAHHVAVASNLGHAAWSCRMLIDWGQPCVAIPLDPAALDIFMPPFLPALTRVRTTAVTGWPDLDTREDTREARTGQPRPPSYLLYPLLGVLRLNGALWRPPAPKHPRVVRWSELGH